MTIDDFLKGLSEVPAAWFTESDGRIRGGYEGHCCCPITAVCRHKTGRWYETPYFHDAAKEIGLSQRDAESIAVAADELQSSRLDDGTVIRLNKNLRRQLLRQLHLEAA